MFDEKLHRWASGPQQIQTSTVGKMWENMTKILVCFITIAFIFFRVFVCVWNHCKPKGSAFNGSFEGIFHVLTWLPQKKILVLFSLEFLSSSNFEIGRSYNATTISALYAIQVLQCKLQHQYMNVATIIGIKQSSTPREHIQFIYNPNTGSP